MVTYYTLTVPTAFTCTFSRTFYFVGKLLFLFTCTFIVIMQATAH